jgi:hypothetical protein
MARGLWHGLLYIAEFPGFHQKVGKWAGQFEGRHQQSAADSTDNQCGCAIGWQ